MKIIYLHQYFNTANVAGSTRSYEFARRLVRDGHDVHVVTSDRTQAVAGNSWHVVDVEGISVHSISQPYSNDMNPAARIRAFLRFAVNASKLARSLRGDVVFATSTPLTIVLPALVATFGRRTPFIMEVRDLWPSVPIAMGYLRNPVVRSLAKWLERVAYRRAAKIIALSPDMADGVIAAGGFQDKVSVIPNMSDTTRFQTHAANGSDFSDLYPQIAGRPFIVYTGTFGRVNGIEYMVKLASAYAAIDANVAFVAMGEGAERQLIVSAATELGVLNVNFFVFDPVPKKDLPLILANAIACSSWVVPIKVLEANSANKLFDAFAAGKPMLINHGGWQEQLLVSSGAGIALSPTDFQAAAKQLAERLSDPRWIAKAQQASARLGRDEFEVEKLYNRFADVLLTANMLKVGAAQEVRNL